MRLLTMAKLSAIQFEGQRMTHFNKPSELQAALDAGAFLFKPEYFPATFTCSNCGQACPLQHSQVGTGYAMGKADNFFCYACCGLIDAFSMGWTGKGCLYLSWPARSMNPAPDSAYGWISTPGQVSNWPGTFKANAATKRGRHNIARYRYDAWFTGPDGKRWHGVTYGQNTQICHCKRVKA